MRFITWVAFATNATGTTNTPMKQKQLIPTHFSSLKFSVQNVLERLQPWDLGALQEMAERCDWQKKSDSTDGQANRTQRDLQLRNATLYFLSSNTTAYTQQLDEVIIKTSYHGFSGPLLKTTGSALHRTSRKNKSINSNIFQISHSVQAHLRATFQISNKIAAVKIVVGSSDMFLYHWWTEKPEVPYVHVVNKVIVHMWILN